MSVSETSVVVSEPQPEVTVDSKDQSDRLKHGDFTRSFKFDEDDSEDEPTKIKPCVPLWAIIAIALTTVAAGVVLIVCCTGGGDTPDGSGGYYNTMRRDCLSFMDRINFTAYQGIDNFQYDSVMSSAEKEKFTKDAENTRPLIHADMIPLLEGWLAHKKAHGTDVEKSVYGSLDYKGLVDRFLTKRAVAFLDKKDVGILRNGENTTDNKFDNIHQQANGSHKLEDYMSYDEMKLAALVAVSSPVQVINNGGRNNKGKKSDDPHVKEAIYIGQVGSRFERSGLMEDSYMNSSKPNDPIHPLLEKFYGVPAGAITQRETIGPFLGNVAKARFRKMAEIHLGEAQYWGNRRGMDVRVSAVGLGAGVWAAGRGAQFNQYIIESYMDAAQQNSEKYSNIKIIEFNYNPFHAVYEKNLKSSRGELSDTVAKDGRKQVKIGNFTFMFHTKDYAFDGCQFNASNELVVANFAWYSMSFPGNEYWLGASNFAASGDPAAACSTTIWNHLNPICNKKYVSGWNAKSVSSDGTIADI